MKFGNLYLHKCCASSAFSTPTAPFSMAHPGRQEDIQGGSISYAPEKPVISIASTQNPLQTEQQSRAG